ncbi:hypothetical protein MFC_00483 [Mesomycoplasma flocculare ATCC 27716]|nr:hypothetical protein MFC_00483 [Mesomycoplasma flocculare ATCC 27716]
MFFRLSGTWFAIIFSAIPSTIAVFPTPGSPTKTGLFFVFLDKILIIRLISESRPITGSILFSFASCVKFLAYFSRFSSSIFIFPLFYIFYFSLIITYFLALIVKECQKNIFIWKKFLVN